MMSSSMRKDEESSSASNLDVKLGRSKSNARDTFKCGTACFYLPRFTKRKSMLRLPSSVQHTPKSTVVSGTSIVRVSTALSFESFDCKFSSSGMVLNLVEEDGWRSPYYDLPVEMIRKSTSPESPVSVAFVFDFEPKKSVNAKRPPSLVQSRSCYVNKSGNNKLVCAPSSCPASPSSGPDNCHRLSKAEENIRPFMNQKKF